MYQLGVIYLIGGISPQYLQIDSDPFTFGTSFTGRYLVGGFNPPEKYESIGMMTFPTEWKNKSHVPVTTKQGFMKLTRKKHDNGLPPC